MERNDKAAAVRRIVRFAPALERKQAFKGARGSIKSIDRPAQMLSFALILSDSWFETMKAETRSLRPGHGTAALPTIDIQVLARCDNRE